MKLIWHIVKKDLRNLRWLLAGWLAVMGLQVTLGIWALNGSEWFFQAHDGVNAANKILIGLQLVMAVFLAAEIVQEDSLVEPKAHWLTLPVSGPQLLAAKLTGFVLIVWILPALVLWPWWLVNHWGVTELALGTLFVVGVHALATLPALLVATMTSNWTRFLTWMVVFIMAVVIGGISLMTQYQSIAVEIRPPETFPLSRAVAGTAVIVALVAAVVVNQYLTRSRARSICAVGVAGLCVALILNFWPADFMAIGFNALSPTQPPRRNLQLQLGSVSGSAQNPGGNGNSMVGLNVEGTVGGLAPEESVYGQLLSVEWKWGSAVVRKWKSMPESRSYFSSTRQDSSLRARSQELFPRQNTLYSLGLPIVPSYVARRLLTAPSAFKAEVEMAVMRREILAEVPPRAGVRFGRGAERFAIVSAERGNDDLYLTMIQTLPDWPSTGFQHFPFWTFRSFVFFNRSDREIVKTLGRTSTQSFVQSEPLGPLGGVLVSRMTYRIHAPREFFSDKQQSERYGPVDPQWFDGIAVVWTETRPVARFETEIVEPHFVVREEQPSRTPSLRH